MKTHRSTIISCAIALCLACCLTACNPLDQIDALFTPTSVADAMANKAAERQATVSTPDVIEEGYLTVGLYTAETTAPFCIAQPSGEVTGMDIELASMIADAMGLKVRFVNVTSVASALGVECDIVMNVAWGTVDGATVVGAYAENATALFHVGDSTVVDAESLYDATVGLQSGSVSQRLLSQNDLRMRESSYDNLNGAFEALAAGEVQYVCCDLYSGAYLASFYSSISLCGTLDVPAAEGIAVASSNTTLQVNVQSALDTIQTNGLFELVRIKWIGGMPNATDATRIKGLV